MIYIKDIIDKTKPIFMNRSIKLAYVFGSYARGEETDCSDIDILIDYGSNTMSMFELLYLKYDLQDVLQKKVDLVCMDALGEDYFSKKIQQEKICIFKNDR